MEMKYCFNLKFQLKYGILTFLLALAIIYIFTKKIDWITPLIVGVFEFAISGYFTKLKCK